MSGARDVRRRGTPNDWRKWTSRRFIGQLPSLMGHELTTPRFGTLPLPLCRCPTCVGNGNVGHPQRRAAKRPQTFDQCVQTLMFSSNAVLHTSLNESVSEFLQTGTKFGGFEGIQSSAMYASDKAVLPKNLSCDHSNRTSGKRRRMHAGPKWTRPVWSMSSIEGARRQRASLVPRPLALHAASNAGSERRVRSLALRAAFNASLERRGQTGRRDNFLLH